MDFHILGCLLELERSKGAHSFQSIDVTSPVHCPHTPSAILLLHSSAMGDMDDLFSSSSSPGTGTGTAARQPMAASEQAPSPGPQTQANADGPSSPSSPSPTPSHHPASRPSAPPPPSPTNPPFSPSKAELESHPVRQRLSLLHSDPDTTLEDSAPAISLELDSWPKPPAGSAQTIEEEGHSESEAIDMADSEIQKGDAGECLRCCFLAILPAGWMRSLLPGEWYASGMNSA